MTDYTSGDYSGTLQRNYNIPLKQQSPRGFFADLSETAGNSNKVLHIYSHCRLRFQTEQNWIDFDSGEVTSILP